MVWIYIHQKQKQINFLFQKIIEIAIVYFNFALLEKLFIKNNFNNKKNNSFTIDLHIYKQVGLVISQ